MRLFRLFVFALAAIHISSAQEAGQGPNAEATLHYIHGAWDTLTRSMTDCHSLVDIKVTTNPILYLPAGMKTPAAVKELTDKCHVRIVSLPKAIERLGDLDPKVLPDEGLLYLPQPYVVPGGRFNEMYGWDSFFILLGLEADRREALAKGMVDNFLFEIENYGGVLNANRTYYLTRSQPPFLTSMIRAVYENPASFAQTAAGRTEARVWLERAYVLAAKDYSTWTRPEHLAGTTGLARYFDYGKGPVPEMADDSAYYPDVIRWIVAHPHQGGDGYLIKGSEHPDAAETERLKQTSCDVTVSVVCMRAWAGGYRLTKDFYVGDRAMRESGFDPSNRFGPFSGETHHFAPVCLNSLLYRYERDMEHLAHVLGKATDAQKWSRLAQKRNAAIHRYLWWSREGVFADWDFTHSRPDEYAYITSLYPLWAGVATREEGRQVVAKLGLFEREGGLSMSNTNTGLQWDEPFGWAPTNWIGVAGLESSGFHGDAARLAQKWDQTVDRGFAQEGTIREKYNVVQANADVQVATGYKQNQIGFGWTNAVYLKMKAISEKDAPAAASARR
ncbi:alpha,alpha-trehalase [Occallatibacter riparius]|uniref:Alpha,alpha-trehalase n=1 Tax=Occallatibacter riparius TaxID=1002689 RepID=A0A9J7BT63_9BACT|nr:alpha,alpha-trehalase [Occallatibacter riparius]UWZ86091.1 alpha,alpha-trehalase [Occallatibacter riparius]